MVDGMRITNGWNILLYFKGPCFLLCMPPLSTSRKPWREGGIYPQWQPELEEGDKFIQDTQC